MRKLLSILFLFLAVKGYSAVYVTTHTADTNVNNSGSLRWAINKANADKSSTINFNIPTTDSGMIAQGDWKYWRITPTSALPVIVGSGTTIDGTSQASFIGGDPNPYGNEIQLWGGKVGGTIEGIVITSANVTIKGLVISSFTSYGILIKGVFNTFTTKDISIKGNYIGINATGTLPMGNLDSGVASGIAGSQGVSGYVDIGGTQISDRNVISGNNYDQVAFYFTQGTGTVMGNYIGTNANGTAKINSIYLSANGGGVTIGQDDFVVGVTSNVIGGCYDGLSVGGSGVSHIVNYNWIGTNQQGILNLGNSNDGIICNPGGSGSDTGFYTNNVIAFNGVDGIRMSAAGASDNLVSMNSMYGNVGKAINLTGGGNHSIRQPMIYSTSTVAVITGTGAINNVIEVFVASVSAVSASGTRNFGQGQVYIGSTTCGGAVGTFSYSTWTLTLWSPYSSYVVALGSVTATQRDASNDTSEFCRNVSLGATTAVTSVRKRILSQVIWIE